MKATKKAVAKYYNAYNADEKTKNNESFEDYILDLIYSDDEKFQEAMELEEDDDIREAVQTIIGIAEQMQKVVETFEEAFEEYRSLDDDFAEYLLAETYSNEEAYDFILDSKSGESDGDQVEAIASIANANKTIKF